MVLDQIFIGAYEKMTWDETTQYLTAVCLSAFAEDHRLVEDPVLAEPVDEC
jgi:hypothetical protein